MISFRGTAYHGFVRQKNAITVQEVLEKTISRIVNHNVTVYGCSRTDSGVHAHNYFLNFFTESTIPNHKLHLALNAYLPPDIDVKEVSDVPLDFQAQFSAKAKQYVYQILLTKDAFMQDLALYYRRDIDIDLVNSAVKYFIGEHDFTSFSSVDKCKPPDRSKVRTIEHLEISKDQDLVTVIIKGNGFLYNMVRIIVGTLLFVNEKKILADDIPEIFEKRERKYAGKTVPPHGLYLNYVWYGGSERYSVDQLAIHNNSHA
jgi:tRNA pseudouridine38-40 synthase